MKGILFGGESFARSLGRRGEVGALMLFATLLGLGFGRISGRNESIFSIKPFSHWGMDTGFTFGKILGVGRFCFLIPSPLCMHWL